MAPTSVPVRLALGGGGYAIREVVPRAWTLLFAEIVEHPELAADVNDPTTVVPQAEAQERVWSALHKDLDRLARSTGSNSSQRQRSTTPHAATRQ